MENPFKAAINNKASGSQIGVVVVVIIIVGVALAEALAMFVK